MDDPIGPFRSIALAVGDSGLVRRMRLWPGDVGDMALGVIESERCSSASTFRGVGERKPTGEAVEVLFIPRGPGERTPDE